jgi:hypothetical protein
MTKTKYLPLLSKRFQPKSMTEELFASFVTKTASVDSIYTIMRVCVEVIITSSTSYLIWII